MSKAGMNQRATLKRNAQFVVVILCAAAVKLYYSTASVNHLRWILAPTTYLVELVSGARFEFESHAGYITSDRSFVIAASCAGVNFLITSFLMLSLRKLWRARARSQNRSQYRSDDPPHNLAWSFIPVAALSAYLATLVANTVRISTALRLRRMPLEISWLSPNQLHRFEGIFIYFGFLLLLFMVSEKMSSPIASSSQHASISQNASGPLREAFFPLLVYYATTLGIPLANGAYRPGIAASDFWEHSVFVLLTPLVLILPLTTFRFFRNRPCQRQSAGRNCLVIRSAGPRQEFAERLTGRGAPCMLTGSCGAQHTFNRRSRSRCISRSLPSHVNVSFKTRAAS